MKNLNIFKKVLIMFSVLPGILWVFLSPAVANETRIDLNSGILILAQGRGHIGGCDRESRHDSGDCRRGGMNHRRGMGHEMRHGMGPGPGLDVEAQ